MLQALDNAETAPAEIARAGTLRANRGQCTSRCCATCRCAPPRVIAGRGVAAGCRCSCCMRGNFGCRVGARNIPRIPLMAGRGVRRFQQWKTRSQSWRAPVDGPQDQLSWVPGAGLQPIHAPRILVCRRSGDQRLVEHSTAYFVTRRDFVRRNFGASGRRIDLRRAILVGGLSLAFTCHRGLPLSAGRARVARQAATIANATRSGETHFRAIRYRSCRTDPPASITGPSPPDKPTAAFPWPTGGLFVHGAGISITAPRRARVLRIDGLCCACRTGFAGRQRPLRPIVPVGDGAFGMTGLELDIKSAGWDPIVIAKQRRMGACCGISNRTRGHWSTGVLRIAEGLSDAPPPAAKFRSKRSAQPSARAGRFVLIDAHRSCRANFTRAATLRGCGAARSDGRVACGKTQAGYRIAHQARQHRARRRAHRASLITEPLQTARRNRAHQSSAALPTSNKTRGEIAMSIGSPRISPPPASGLRPALSAAAGFPAHAQTAEPGPLHILILGEAPGPPVHTGSRCALPRGQQGDYSSPAAARKNGRRRLEESGGRPRKSTRLQVASVGSVSSTSVHRQSDIGKAHLIQGDAAAGNEGNVNHFLRVYRPRSRFMPRPTSPAMRPPMRAGNEPSKTRWPRKSRTWRKNMALYGPLQPLSGRRIA